MSLIRPTLYNYSCSSCSRHGVLRLFSDSLAGTKRACPGCGEIVQLEWAGDTGYEMIRSPHPRSLLKETA